jgi:hypothetical protein
VKVSEASKETPGVPPSAVVGVLLEEPSLAAEAKGGRREREGRIRRGEEAIGYFNPWLTCTGHRGSWSRIQEQVPTDN